MKLFSAIAAAAVLIASAASAETTFQYAERTLSPAQFKLASQAADEYVRQYGVELRRPDGTILHPTDADYREVLASITRCAHAAVDAVASGEATTVDEIVAVRSGCLYKTHGQASTRPRVTEFTEQPDDLAPTVIVVQVPVYHYWYRTHRFVPLHAWYAPRRCYHVWHGRCWR